MRLERDAAAARRRRLALGAEVAVDRAHADDTAAGRSPGCSSRVVPWFLVMRLIRRLAERRDEAEALVEELRESRAAHAESAALAERGRVARDMHDVLAHSLSALALQLEGTRLLARDRGADPEVSTALERAHHLAGERADRGAPGDRRAARRRAARARAAARAGRRVRRQRATLTGHRRAARAVLRGAARALPHRPGGADQRAPAQRRRPRRDRGSTTPTTARRSSSRTTARARRVTVGAAAAATG